jgi:glutathione S-transferase
MKLYYTQGACSLAPHLILEELRIPYDTQEVSSDRGDHDKPEFKKLNPLGAVPVLQLDNGQPLTENVAILSYLADLKPEKKLLPPVGTLERARAVEWLSFLATETHKPFGMLFAAGHVFKNAATIEEVKARGRDLVTNAFNIIEARLSSNGFALGPNYSVVDAYLFVFFSWAKYLDFDRSLWPKYGSLVARITERPATLKVLKHEDLLD